MVDTKIGKLLDTIVLLCTFSQSNSGLDNEVLPVNLFRITCVAAQCSVDQPLLQCRIYMLCRSTLCSSVSIEHLWRVCLHE